MTNAPSSARTKGLKLVTSNRLEILAARLAEAVRPPLASPFQAEVVVVQSQGMARWLQLELARRLGVCANLRCPFPKAFAWEIFRALDPALPKERDTEPEVLVWRLLRLLPTLAGREEFAALGHYATDDASGRKRFQLAARLARLFDDYLIYRPEMVLEWDEERSAELPFRANQNDPRAEPEFGAPLRWQAALWRELRRAGAGPHPAALREACLDKLRRLTAPPEGLPARVSIFGIAALPPFYVELFEQLAACVEVNLFLLQPAREYWGDITSARSTLRSLRQQGHHAASPSSLHYHAGNRLLASLGGQGRDFLNVLLSVTEFNSDDEFADSGTATLLAAIQSDILNLSDRGASTTDAGFSSPSPPSEGGEGRGEEGRLRIISDTPHPGPLPTPPSWGEGEDTAAGIASNLDHHCTPIAPDDDSIQIHSCHSPLRELEVLHDRMLDWFARDPALSPRDILVMMPDIETYAPFVEAVFSARESDRCAIPFSLADRGSNQASHVVSAFLALLNLAGSRLGAASVLALLETPVVRGRFGLAEADLFRVRQWLTAAGVRWGRDAEHRAALQLPPLRENTWREGLDRLLLGYAMSGRTEELFGGLLPCDAVEGQTSETLGRLLSFAEKLFTTLAKLEAARPPAEWVMLLREIVESFFHETDDTEPELQIIRGALRELERHQQLAGFTESIPLAVVLEHLAPALAEDRVHHGFLTGRVTFGALKPMRSIPFKIICLVGLNDTAFPRADTRLGFDLMAQSPRLGDHSKREDDRYLFLETLLSARQKLYLSYVGQSIRDNSPAPPSVLVSELMDYIQQGFARPDGKDILINHVCFQHRLQAFSAAYFRKSGRLFSYSQENFAAARALRGEITARVFAPAALPEPDAEWRTVNLDHLAEFFANPAKFFVTRRLDLRLPARDAALAEREPIELEGLESYDLKLDLLERRVAGADLAAAYPLLKAAGRLPLGRVGEAEYRSLCERIERFHLRLEPYQPAQRLAPVEVDWALDEFRVKGCLSRLTPAGLLSYRPASLKPKDLVRAWVQHLVWNALPADGTARVSVVIGEEAKKRGQSRFVPVAQAHERLREMFDLYWRGLREPLKFFPAASLVFVETETANAERDPDARKDPLAEARDAWLGDDYHRGEIEDDYFKLCFGSVDPLDGEFEKMSRQICEPLLQHEEAAS